MGLLLDGNSWVTSTTSYSRASSDHAVMYWLRLDSNAAVRRPFGNTGNWEARTSAGSNVLTSDYLQSGTLPTATLTGGWDHVAFVQDVTGGERLTYLNGALVLTTNPASFVGVQNGNLMIGVTPGGAGQGWFGGIDDIRVYDRLPSAAEIQTIYAARGLDGISLDLTLRYLLDERGEGQGVTGPVVSSGSLALDLPTVTGTPTYDYSCGIRSRRRVA